MPLYEYVCNQCGTPFEKMAKLSESNQKPECPHCGSAQTSKQLSKIASPAFGTADRKSTRLNSSH